MELALELTFLVAGFSTLGAGINVKSTSLVGSGNWISSGLFGIAALLDAVC